MSDDPTCGICGPRSTASSAQSMCGPCERSYDVAGQQDGSVWAAMAWAAMRARKAASRRWRAKRRKKRAGPTA